ncbi:30S ribosome-binding factor RbfA [Longivirga aurantiaca]|uniref:Ribosome-binding factor A n=1 Tax=Longivirga aurantiaca TaxID=1837743 RepID=A0ABW1T0Z4_9ACTN
MADPARARKLADRIKVIVAETLEQRIKDPRVGFLTITDSRVTGDLHDATVYYTVYGSDEEKAGTAAALESAKGVLRSEIGKQTGVRFTPTLTFVADAVPENAAAIEDLLAVAAAADAEVHEKAAAAQYAGEADPYKKPRDLEDDDAGDAEDAEVDEDDDEDDEAGDELEDDLDDLDGLEDDLDDLEELIEDEERQA